MKFEQILSDLKAKKYAPIYFLTGDESYFIDHISDFISQQILSQEEKDFNQHIFYGKEATPDAIIGTAKQFPLMGQYVVVIVKEAQLLSKIEQLERYFEQPLASTILVICYKNKRLDKRQSFAKSVQKNTLFFESKKLYDNQIPDWIVDYLSNKNISIDLKAAHLLVEYLGNDLNKISNELEKLMIITPQGTKVDADIIEKNSGISKDFNNFELTNCLAKKDALKAHRIGDYFAKNPKSNPLIVTLVTLFNFYQKVLIYHTLKDQSNTHVAKVLKINPYFVKDYQMAAKNYSKRKCMNIISHIREYDMKCKGLENNSVSDGELLKELLFKILH